jgi:hypothetical protein
MRFLRGEIQGYLLRRQVIVQGARLSCLPNLLELAYFPASNLLLALILVHYDEILIAKV